MDNIKDNISENVKIIFDKNAIYKKGDFKVPASTELVRTICKGIINLTEMCNDKTYNVSNNQFIELLNRLYFKGMYYEMLMFVRLTTVDNKLASQENCIKFMDNLRDFTK